MEIPEDLSEDLIEKANQRIEWAIERCDDCEGADDIFDCCLKHKKMYATINP